MSKTINLKNFDFANLTDKGLQREKNEDFLAYFDTCNGHVFVLCDGMGGHQAGEYASKLAVETIGVFLNEKYIKNPFDAVENAIKTANIEVFKKSKSNSNYSGMGTTITLTLIRDNRIYYGHIGDSRIYLFSKNKLTQITKDHSYVQSLVDKGIISEKEAEKHPRKNEISKALGLEAFIEPDVAPSALIPHNNDLLLLCSDGLNNMINNKKIESEFKKNKPIITTASELINLANKKGGNDNISVQLIKFFNLDTEIETVDIKETKFRKFINFLKYNKTVIIGIVFFIAFLLSIFFILQKNKTEIKPKTKHVSQFNVDDLKSQIIIYAYKLKKGDTFQSIAEKFNLNDSVLRDLNPNITEIKEGLHFKIIIRDFYTVNSGDDLEIILKKFRLNSIELMKANDFCDQQVHVGQELIIPCYKK